jgi:hypothetical protein
MPANNGRESMLLCQRLGKFSSKKLKTRVEQHQRIRETEIYVLIELILHLNSILYKFSKRLKQKNIPKYRIIQLKINSINSNEP